MRVTITDRTTLTPYISRLNQHQYHDISSIIEEPHWYLLRENKSVDELVHKVFKLGFVKMEITE